MTIRKNFTFAQRATRMSELDRIRKPVENEIGEFEKVFRSSMKSNIPLLTLVTNYVLRRKGKQIRPIFVFLSASLNGGVKESTYVASSMIELLHTATLIHDDVVDESYERRGFFSINALWRSKIAVLLGDYMLAKGLLVAVQHKEYELLDIVSEAVREMSEGEILQLQKSRKNGISAEEYFEIIRKKTATLIAACTASGARSAGAEPEKVQLMKEFGEYVGIAFQIKDDILDYQKKGLTGKPSGNDIKDQKYTLPLILGIEKSDAAEQRRIRRMMGTNHMNTGKIESIIRFAEQSGGLESARQQMNEYRDKALGILGSFPENDARKALQELVVFITERDH
ncbi:MAG: polyprenyl synthetase family protein [Bacteroidales bacterium]